MSKKLNNKTIKTVWLLTRAAAQLKDNQISLISPNIFTNVCYVDGNDQEKYEIKITKI